MGVERRDGKRKSRSEITNRRKPELGYYLIVTDTEGTERVYFNGLRDSIRSKVGDKLIIKVSETKNKKMIYAANEFLSETAQYAEPWIVFDRDKNKDFDKIIEEAHDLNIKVAWSNPCIEIWFDAYFGEMPSWLDSVQCCTGFSNKYQKKIGQEYNKTDKKLYQKLIENGNEENAIKLAANKMKDHIQDGKTLPSEMVPCTTVYELVKEIKDKI